MKVLQIFCLLSLIAVVQLFPSNNDVTSEVTDSSENKIEGSEIITSYRLPNNSIPLRYDLWIKTDVEQENFNFSGRVKIHVEILEPSKKIILHLNDTKVDKIDLLDSEGQLAESNLSFEYNNKFQFLIIFLPRILTVNEKIVLDIEYHGTLRDDKAGFYRASYKNDKNKTIWYATTQFETIYVRHVMPCYDEPQIRAIFSVQIQHTKNYNAISNMPIASREEIPDSDYVTSKFVDTLPMQTYLLAFVISDFKYVSNNDSRVEQRIYAKPQSIENGDAEFILGIVGPLLKKIEEIFDFEYPLPKIDHAVITDYAASGMENFGLITYNEKILVKGEDVGKNHEEEGDHKVTDKVTKKPSNQKFKEQMTIEIVSHELAHQYFGNIVAPKWWTYGWLNEGFAALYERYLASLVFPDGNYMEKFKERVTQRSMLSEKKFYGNKTLSYYVEETKDVEDCLDRIVYNKGAAIVYMFHEALTPETFTKGMKYYLKAMKFSAATPDDLHRELQKAFDEDFPGNGVDVDAAMKTWEDQKGYPIVKVKKSDGKFILTQENFKGGEEIYAIPISYATKSSPNFDDKKPKLWMTTKTAEINIDDDWIVLNIGQSGYYEVSYDDELYSYLVELALSNDKYLKLQKDELFEEFMKRDVKFDGDVGLRIMKIMVNEVKYQSWGKLYQIFKFYNERFYGTEVYPKYQKFIENILDGTLNRLGFEEKKEESLDEKYIRYYVWFMLSRIENTSFNDFATKKLENFLETGKKNMLICQGFKQANETVQAKVLEKYSNSSEDENIWGCSLNRDMIWKDLQYVMNSSMDVDTLVEDLLPVFQCRSPISSEVTFDYFIENYDVIFEISPEVLKVFFRPDLYYMSYNENTDKLKKILLMMDDSKKFDEIKIKKAFKNIEENRKWSERNLKYAETWFEELQN